MDKDNVNKVKLKVTDTTKIFGENTSQALEMLQRECSKEEILKETGCTVGVKHASFEVYDNEIFVIMGLSGSGKSTLVRLLNRLIEPTSGSIMVGNDEITNLNTKDLNLVRRKKISMVFQKFALYPHKTVLQNTALGLEIQGVPKAQREEKALKTLNMVGLGNYGNSYPDQLSGGMQQRVGIARALTSDTDILLMDEAFSALDPLIRKDMQNELIVLQEKMKKTIIFITHDLDEALHIGDRIALMKDGEIVQIGTPVNILTNPANDYVKSFVKDIDVSKVIQVGSIMNTKLIIDVNHSVQEGIDLLQQNHAFSALISDKGTLSGYIYLRDLLSAHNKNDRIANYTNHCEYTIECTELLHHVFPLMKNIDYPLPVVDNNRLLGYITPQNVINVLGSDYSAAKTDSAKKEVLYVE